MSTHHPWGNQMKKSLACCLAILVLAGCATAQEPPGSQPVETASATPSRPAATTKAEPKTTEPTAERSSALPASGLEGLTPAETVYIGQLVQSHPRLREKSNEELLDVGGVPCTLYDNGATGSQVNDFLIQAAGVAYLLEEFASIHGIGVAALCPEHLEQLG